MPKDREVPVRKFSTLIEDVEVTVFLKNPAVGTGYGVEETRVCIHSQTSALTPVQARRIYDALSYCLRKARLERENAKTDPPLGGE